MNFSEFKGFMEGIEQSFKDGRPSEEQWQIIRQKLVNVYPDVQYIPQQPTICQPKIIGPYWSSMGGAK